jgi:IS30 family transposase
MYYYSSEVKDRVVGLVRGGMTAAAAAATVGADQSTVTRWCARAGLALRRGRRPRGEGVRMEDLLAAGRPARTSPRSRLTLADRAAIQEGMRAGRSLRSIAADLGFSHTTVSREVRRASVGGAYDFACAQRRAEREARRPRARRLDSDAVLRAYVAAGLARAWSPRQVCERMRLEFPDDGRMRVSHETVYRALYVQGRGALRHELGCEQALRSGRRSRRPRSRLPRRPGRGWVEGCEISLRPPEAADRAVPGHWEGDLVVGGDGRSCLVTLVERKTRYLQMRRLLSHESRTVVDLLAAMVAEVPGGVRRALMSTLTWDQGTEMALHAEFTRATGFKVYFCDPHSPWQKGTNENTNGLIRQYFPKGTEFADVTDEEVRRVQDLLNGRPRETLGWRTPAEAIAEVLSEASEAGAMTA